MTDQKALREALGAAERALELFARLSVTKPPVGVGLGGWSAQLAKVPVALSLVKTALRNLDEARDLLPVSAMSDNTKAMLGLPRAGEAGTAGATHRLKTWPQFFRDILAGKKRFELRRNDRAFAVGDALLLQEYDPASGTYSGREATFAVSYILDAANACAVSDSALHPGYAILSIEPAVSPPAPVPVRKAATEEISEALLEWNARRWHDKLRTDNYHDYDRMKATLEAAFAAPSLQQGENSNG